MVLIFKSFVDNLTKLNILTGERQRGESWALENVLNPTPGSQDQAVCSQSLQISNNYNYSSNNSKSSFFFASA